MEMRGPQPVGMCSVVLAESFLISFAFFSLTYGLQCIEMLLGPFPSHVVSERSSGGLWRSAIMAEVIQERVEDRLPELEQLERTGLFSHAEIK